MSLLKAWPLEGSKPVALEGWALSGVKALLLKAGRGQNT